MAASHTWSVDPELLRVFGENVQSQELKLSLKYLGKRYGLSDVSIIFPGPVITSCSSSDEAVAEGNE